jgi:replication-associated recombination protein RarA
MEKFLPNYKPKPKAKTEDQTPKIEALDIQDDRLIPWIEKYRPQNLDEVVYQSNAIDSLKKSIKVNKLQHLLFYGPPGTGKTSTILAVKIILNMYHYIIIPLGS